MFGIRYASLDSTSDGKCVPNRSYRMPEGWELAQNDQASLISIYLGGWDTYVIAVGDSTGYYAGEYNVQADYSVLFTAPDGFGPGIPGYSVLSCAAIILISQPFPIPEFATGHQRIGAPVVDNNFITFEGTDYAVGDNSAYVWGTTPSTCQSYSVFLNGSAWSLAAAAPGSKVALQSNIDVAPHGNWGAFVLILADGNAYGANTSQVSLSNALSTTSFQGGTIYGVKNCSLIAKILLSRTSAAGTPNSWITQATITETYVYGTGVNETTFATIDNIAQSVTAPCQAQFMAIPTGYTAASTAKVLAFVVNPGWSAWVNTYCWGSTDGVAYYHPDTTTGIISTCGNVISETVNGVAYYQATPCGRVLIVAN